MYPGRVGEAMGIANLCLRYEADLICYTKFQERQAQINESIGTNEKTQIAALQRLIQNGTGKVKNR
jgi:hypothetical protein